MLLFFKCEQNWQKRIEKHEKREEKKAFAMRMALANLWMCNNSSPSKSTAKRPIKYYYFVVFFSFFLLLLLFGL